MTATVAAAAPAHAAPDPAPLQRTMQRLEVREATLAEQARAMAIVARRQARAAYRLARRRQLGFLPAPASRLEDAQAFDLALLALGRSLRERQTLAREAARAAGDRVVVARTLDGRDDADPDRPPPEFMKPCRGPVVGEPGLTRDRSTGVELSQHAVQLLARLNEPVRAPAAGVVRRVEALPQGGHGVAIEHEAGWVSLIDGLRDVLAAPGQRVEAGTSIGLAGRNLDGAAIIAVELWRGRTPVDPRPLLR